ncbi:MAG: hypothetical protein ACRDKW_09395, partial [Actinomycetota bacterium]
GLSFTTGDGTADATMIFTGTTAAVNAALDGMTYTPAADYFGPGSIAVTTSDQGNTGSGGAQSDTDTLTVTVDPVNDTPAFTKGPDQTADENSGAHTVHPWATGLSAGPGETQGLTFPVTGNTNTALFAAGPAVSSTGVLTYTLAADQSGFADVTITLSDDGGTAGGGDDTSDPQTFRITVTPVNDPPVNTLPAAPSVDEDAVLTLSGAGAISVADADAGAAEVQVALTSTNGVMTLDGTTGLSLTTGDGTADAAITFTGTIAAANAALDGMTFTPTANFSGPPGATIQVVTDDLGNAGAGGAKSDTDVLAITVNPVNDPPTISDIADRATDEDTPTGAVAFTVGDIDNPVASLVVT